VIPSSYKPNSYLQSDSLILTWDIVDMLKKPCKNVLNLLQSLSPMIMDHFKEGVSTKEIIHLQQISEKSELCAKKYNLIN